MSRRRAAKKKQRQRVASSAGLKANDPTSSEGPPGAPASIVVRRGRLAAPCRLLVKDWRQVMGPRVAAKLKESRKNKRRDFESVAGSLGVTHLQTLTQTDNGVYLRIAKLPRGPTITFQVLGFSLISDVQRHVSGARLDPKDLRRLPVLVLSNSSSSSSSSNSSSNSSSSSEGLGISQAQELTTSMLRSLFAPVDVHTATLNDFRRIAFFRRASDKDNSSRGDGVFYYFRHYSVSLKAAKLTAGVKHVLEAAAGTAAQKRLLQRLQQHQHTDPCDLLLEGEKQEQQQNQQNHHVVFDPAACPSRVSKTSSLQLLLPTKQQPQQQQQQQQNQQQQQQQQQQEELSMAVQLREIGPRLELRLLKIEDDVCTGKVLYHAHISKTAEDLKMLKKKEHLLKAKREEERQKLLELLKPKAKAKGAEKATPSEEKPEHSISSSGKKREREDTSESEDPSLLDTAEDDQPMKRAKFNPFTFKQNKPATSDSAPARRGAAPNSQQRRGNRKPQQTPQTFNGKDASGGRFTPKAAPQAKPTAAKSAATSKGQEGSGSSKWRGSNKNRVAK